MPWTYILRCSDQTYYVGHTVDLGSRVKRHQDGQGPEYTRCRTPIELVYSETYPSVTQAAKREQQLKRWSKAKKEALIAGDLGKLKLLSRCRSP